ncbi:hypothetical protein LguiA_009573 [Lonicera macranthoides]
MEDTVSDQSSALANTGKPSSKLLRYPLRSATKSKEAKSPVAELSNSSATKRGRPAASVSKSVSVLDLSGKDKSAKPPRRLSIPAKSATTPAPKPIGNITPISEARAKRSVSNQGKSDTPVSDVSRSSNRKKFSVLSSASYWISQIKLSESAAKHSISLGFFKLALEAGSEPLQRMRDELKSYVRQHNLVELGEPVKALFESYNILENFEPLQVSETCSHVPEEGTRLSDDDVRCCSSITGMHKLKPKSLNVDAGSGSPVKESTKENKSNAVSKVKGPANKNSAKSKLASESATRKTEKKSQKPSKKESNKKHQVQKQGKEAGPEEGSINLSPAEEGIEENKENMEDASQMEEEITLIEVQA